FEGLQGIGNRQLRPDQVLPQMAFVVGGRGDVEAELPGLAVVGKPAIAKGKDLARGVEVAHEGDAADDPGLAGDVMALVSLVALLLGGGTKVVLAELGPDAVD